MFRSSVASIFPDPSLSCGHQRVDNAQSQSKKMHRRQIEINEKATEDVSTALAGDEMVPAAKPIRHAATTSLVIREVQDDMEDNNHRPPNAAA